MTMSGSSGSTNPQDVVWWCHMCNWHGVLDVGQVHKCRDDALDALLASAGHEAHKFGGNYALAERSMAEWIDRLLTMNTDMATRTDDLYRAGENSVHADILAFIEDDLGIDVDDRYTEPLRALKADRDGYANALREIIALYEEDDGFDGPYRNEALREVAAIARTALGDA